MLVINRKYIIGIILVMIVAILLVSVLAFTSLRHLYENNGFTRKFLSTDLQILKSVEKDSWITGIAGSTDHRLYFTTVNPAKLYVTDLNLENTSYKELNMAIDARVANAFTCIVDSPYVHVFANNHPAVIAGDLSGNTFNQYKFPSRVFTRVAKLSNSTFVFRGFDTAIKEFRQIFIKGNPATKEIVRKDNVLGKGQDQAGIASDGYLKYDNMNKVLLFTSYYSNEVFCLDTNLNLISKTRTIDTTNISTAISTSIKQDGTKSFTNKRPKQIVNKNGIIINGNHYNLSNMRADNESVSDFRERGIFDIYDVRNGKYKGSFYIPNYKNEKITDFKMVRNKLVVIYNTYIVEYLVPQNILNV